MSDSTFIEQEVQRLHVKYLGKIHFDHTLEESIGNPDQLLKTQVMKDQRRSLTNIQL